MNQQWTQVLQISAQRCSQVSSRLDLIIISSLNIINKNFDRENNVSFEGQTVSQLRKTTVCQSKLECVNLGF